MLVIVSEEQKTFTHLRSGFVSRLVESHRVSPGSTSRLKPVGEQRYNSHRPWMWPVCFKSQVWYDVNFRIVLLGNPVIFWINLVFLFVAPLLLLHHYYKHKRGYTPSPRLAERKERIVFAVKWLFLAYLLHYVPFYTMDRILYYHHYFPALQFSSMLTAVVLGYFLESLPSWLSPDTARLAFPLDTASFFAIFAYRLCS
nr:protein O-mannosyl-transferase 2-like [Cherax quadricarinatus]